MPTGLVKNEVGFAAYEAGVSALSILAPYEMARHGHRRLARLGQGIDVVSSRVHGRAHRPHDEIPM
jgi:hypothetical protein